MWSLTGNRGFVASVPISKAIVLSTERCAASSLWKDDQEMKDVPKLPSAASLVNSQSPEGDGP